MTKIGIKVHDLIAIGKYCENMLKKYPDALEYCDWLEFIAPDNKEELELLKPRKEIECSDKKKHVDAPVAVVWAANDGACDWCEGSYTPLESFKKEITA